MAHRTNAFLDALLQWENRNILFRKMYREETHPSMDEFPCHVDKASGQKYYTFSWAFGKAPANVEIEVSVDYSPPPESGLEYPIGAALHNHDFFEISYVYSGECLSTISGQERTLRAGDICLYNLQALHNVQRKRRGDVLFNILIRQDLFQRSFLDLLSENDLITNFFLQSIYNIKNDGGQLLLRLDAQYHSEQIIQQMIELYYRDVPMCQSLLKAMLILLLAEMARQYRNELHADSADPQDTLLSEVMTYLNSHYSNVTLKQLSAHFGYSTRTMVRFIQRSTGSTFKEIILHLRFQQACAFLRDLRIPIYDVATRVGYQDRSSFDRAFKQSYRISPAEYRRRYHK